MALRSLFSRYSRTCIIQLSPTAGSKVAVYASTMSTWPENKEKFLSMDLETKRKQYVSKKYVTLNSVPTWEEQCENVKHANPSTDEDNSGIQISIDTSLNKIIAQKISVWKGDITQLEIDAIVNAANCKLLGGGGVDGAIHKAAGPELKSECATLNGCGVGSAKITGGYLLPSKYVIHTVGPRDKSSERLQSCYQTCLKLQTDYKIKSIAFPCISTGIYHFPNKPAAHIACSNVRKFLENNIKNENNTVERVIFCVFMQEDVDIYQRLAQLYFPLE